MSNNQFCQSCSMPLDKPEMMGTEKDGTKSKEYCTYCYQHGAFVNPSMTLPEMTKMVKEQMEKRKIDKELITKAVNILPSLKRWHKPVKKEHTQLH